MGAWGAAKHAVRHPTNLQSTALITITVLLRSSARYPDASMAMLEDHVDTHFAPPLQPVQQR